MSSVSAEETIFSFVYSLNYKVFNIYTLPSFIRLV